MKVLSNPDTEVDEDLLAVWFANSIMAGSDEANRQAREREANQFTATLESTNDREDAIAKAVKEMSADERYVIAQAWEEHKATINRMVPLDRSGESHDPYLAVDRSPMDKDELYFVIRFAERLPYHTAITRLTPGYPWSTIRRWFIWIGGWESTELGQWDRGRAPWHIWRDRCDWKPEPKWKAYLRRLTAFSSPTPISLLGHTVTFYGWGLSVRLNHLRENWGTLNLTCPYAGALPHKLYWSPNGTPSHEKARMLWQRQVKSNNN
jgi:hypothetical protein